MLQADELAGIAAEHADAADRDRTLGTDVVKGLVAAGFPGHFVPTAFGGAAGTATDLLAAVSSVADSCASAAWCASVVAAAARMGVYLPPRGQQELWAAGPDVVVAGALIPSGQVSPVDDGWVLTGEWPVTSGIDFADWSLVAAVVDGALWFFAVPRADYEVRDTWFPIGMRGTGSNTLVLADVFVPRHRGFPREEMWHGRAIGSSARCHTVPLRVISGVLFAAPAIGAARGALRSWASLAKPSHEKHLAFARSSGEIDAAELLLRRAASVCDQEAVTADEAARNPSHCALAVDMLVGAVERLFRAAGTSGQQENGALPRFWRDLHFMSSHVALRFDTAGAAYGQHALEHTGRKHP